MMDERLDVRVRLSADRPSSTPLTAAPKTKPEGSWIPLVTDLGLDDLEASNL